MESFTIWILLFKRFTLQEVTEGVHEDELMVSWVYPCGKGRQEVCLDEACFTFTDSINTGKRHGS